MMSEATKKGLVPVLRFPEFRDSAEWDSVKLKALTSVITKGTTPTSVGYQFTEFGINFIKIESITEEGAIDLSKVAAISEVCNEALKRSQLEQNDILFSIAGALGVVAVVKDGDLPANTNQALAIVRLNDKDSLGFITGYLKTQNVQSVIRKIKAGAAQPNISLGQLGDFDVLLPKLPEQQKIADCLSSIDELIIAQAQKIEVLKAHKKGLMQQIFPAEGETVPKLRFPEFRDGGEWIDAPLVRLAKFRRGSFPQPYGLPEWYDEVNGMPFVQVFDVGDDLRLKPKTKNKISKLGAEQSVFIAKGTLIITLQGSIGRVAITQYDAYIDRTLLIFEEFFQPTESYFFAYVIQNLFEIEKEKAPGGIIKTITKEALSDFIVKLPNLSEQQKIANFLSSIDDLIAAQAQKLIALKAHKKGLMHQLFPAMDEVDA